MNYTPSGLALDQEIQRLIQLKARELNQLSEDKWYELSHHTTFRRRGDEWSYIMGGTVIRWVDFHPPRHKRPWWKFWADG